MFILWSVRDVSPNSAAEKLCYDIIFPKLPIWEANHSESHKSGLPAGHQLFTTCSFTSSRRICIIYSSPWCLLDWMVSKHRNKIAFLWAFARGDQRGKLLSCGNENFSQKKNIQELDFLALSIILVFGKSSMHILTAAVLPLPLCTLHWLLCQPCRHLQAFPRLTCFWQRQLLMLGHWMHQAMWINNKM